MEVYESHMGGIYLTNEVRPLDDLYCEVCGDSDVSNKQKLHFIESFADDWKRKRSE